MGCGNALTKFRGVATRSARAALLFRLTVVSLPFGFAAPSVDRASYSRGPFSVHPAGDSVLKMHDPLTLSAQYRGEMPDVNVVHTALKALRIGSFMDAEDWADHLSDGSKAVGSAMTAVRKAKDRAERSLRNAVAARKRERDKFVIADAKFGLRRAARTRTSTSITMGTCGLRRVRIGIRTSTSAPLPGATRP